MASSIYVWTCGSCKLQHRMDWDSAVLTLPRCNESANTAPMLPELVPMSAEVAQAGRKSAGLISLSELRAELDARKDVA